MAARIVLSQIDALGSFTALDRQLEAICWTHRGEGWSVHDWRGAGRGRAVRTKREAERLVREWAKLEPSIEGLRTAYPAPVAYVYEADLHCPPCAAKRFGVDANGAIPESAIDAEGNRVGAVSPWEPWETHDWPCGTCGVVIPASESAPVGAAS